MNKMWEDMTQGEKIETLREELKSLGNYVRELSTRHEALVKRHDALAVFTHEVAKEVETLKAR